MKVKWWHIALFVFFILIVAVVVHPTRLRLSWMLVKSGKPMEAIQNLTQIYSKDPKNYRAIKILAEALENMGRPEESMELFEKLVELKPTDENFKELARFYMWTKNPAQAKRAYQRWFDFRKGKKIGFTDDDGTEIVDNLYSLSLLARDYKSAIEALKVRRQLHPDQAHFIDNDMITLYEKAGDLDGTIAYIESLLAKDKGNVYALEKYMQLAPLAGKKDAARNVLIEDIETNPKDVAARKRFVDFETVNKELGAADEWYRKWMERSPTDQALKKEYLNWLLATDQQKPAIAFLEAVSEEERKPFEETLVRLYEWNNMKEKLVEPYIARFEKNPNDAENAKKLVWLLIDLKQYDKAETVLKRLVELHPGNSEYALALADIYQTKDKTDASIAVMEKAVQKNRDPKLLKQLGVLYLSAGENR